MPPRPTGVHLQNLRLRLCLRVLRRGVLYRGWWILSTSDVKKVFSNKGSQFSTNKTSYLLLLLFVSSRFFLFRPVWVAIASEIGTLGDSSRVVSIWISRWEAWPKGAQGVMGRRNTKGRDFSSPSPLELPLTALISLKLIGDWQTTGDESGTAAPDCDAGYRRPIDWYSCGFIISTLTLPKLDFKNIPLTSKPLHWTTALKSQETIHPLFCKCVTAFCNSFVTSSLCIPSTKRNLTN